MLTSGDGAVAGLEALSVPVPIAVPVCAASLLSHRSVVPAANEHIEKVTVPVGLIEGRLPVTVAVSWTAVAGLTELLDACVFSAALQLPKLVSTKSFNVAVVDVEERVSDSRLAKHSLAMPAGRSDRLMPPS